MSVTIGQEKASVREQSNESDRRPERRLLEGYLHKTSNTLCGIKGYASLIADRESRGDDAGLWARKIIREVERMEEIFRSVGDLTRGRGNPDTGVSLPRFVTETVDTLAGRYVGLEIILRPLPHAELRLPAADLALVIKELLENCSESTGPTPAGIRVEVSGFTLPDGRVFMEISDNGLGMDAELAAQAADPFVTTKDGRHGVGLTRVDTLMDMYGLGWSLDSVAGRGTRVRLEVAEAV